MCRLQSLRRPFLVLALIIAQESPLLAQGSAGSSARIEPRYLVDIPTAGMIPKGNFAVDADFYQDGGVLLGFSVGVLDRLYLGISYGGSSLIGSGKPVMNELPGMTVRIRILEETIALPALVIGFDSQGRDGYNKSLSRYSIKSPGFFGAVSKNYLFLGFLSFHGGVNYSLERADGGNSMNVFAGLEKTLGPFLSAVMEYNLGANDGSNNSLGSGKGYLNVGLRCSLGGGLTLGVNLKDLARNTPEVTIGNRTVRIEYIRPF